MYQLVHLEATTNYARALGKVFTLKVPIPVKNNAEMGGFTIKKGWINAENVEKTRSLHASKSSLHAVTL